MLKSLRQEGSEDGPVGLDDRPRPASARARIIKGLKQSAPFSSLQRRIIFFNLVGLALLVSGMSVLSNDRQEMTELYVDALRKQGEIISIGIAEAAGVDVFGRPAIDPVRAAAVLSRLAPPTGVRVRLYDNGQRLTADTYNLGPASPPIEVSELAPPSSVPQSELVKRIERVYDRIAGYFREPMEIYYEVPVSGISRDEEVLRAARGQIFHRLRYNSQGEAIISVAMPITRLKAIMGVLQLSTAGGAIQEFAREERQAVLEIFFLAAIVSVLLSILLANMIATPIRMLARAAYLEGAGGARPLSPEKPDIPDLTHRTDEIGDLSGALIRMTSALYSRIGAIESFAADVAHEIKNPLTSLRSAVETMQYAKTDEQRQRLLDVIANDVNRMDRLVTDISNASRLDAELVREPMEAFDLAELIQMLAQVTESQGVKADVKVVTHLPNSAFVATGLEGRLAQVITNLMGNALSFSPEGSTITVKGMNLQGGGVRVIVEDEGPGIPPENLESIFERFYSERPETEAFGNHSGLGLSISKQIIETHGGKIWAENLPGTDAQPRGARFVFELPE
ncbi:MAG: stimulus-sensing domain-containing protein [Pseudomonadota bacterium]